MRKTLTLLLVVAAASAPAVAQGKKRKHPWLGKRLPTISAPKRDWVNTDDPPKARDLRDKVVWIHFSFLT